MPQPSRLSRRAFLARSAFAGAGLLALPACAPAVAEPFRERDADLRLGLVTYLWGRDWDVPTLIRNMAATGYGGVELRTEHAHGVESTLGEAERRAVRARFADSPVTLVGLGTNFAYHTPDPAELQANIEGTKRYLQLSHDVGGSGVKVKPNALPDGVPHEKTIAQIGRALNEVARYGADLGQEVRVEVHGRQTQQLPVMKQIMAAADHPNATVCWNCNQQDLDGAGLAHNFGLVDEYFGRTVHVRELDDPDYPYQQLMNLFVGIGYEGWILLEARTEPEDRLAALRAQARLFDAMVARAKRRADAGG